MFNIDCEISCEMGIKDVEDEVYESLMDMAEEAGVEGAEDLISYTVRVTSAICE